MASRRSKGLPKFERSVPDLMVCQPMSEGAKYTLTDTTFAADIKAAFVA
jgi:hypothetical protein